MAVRGFGRGVILVSTWRDQVLIRGKEMDHGVAIWGDAIGMVRGSVRRFGHMVLNDELKKGFVVEGSDTGCIEFHRPGFGLRSEERKVIFSTGDGTWTYRSVSPVATGLLRRDGTPIARFSPWAVDVADIRHEPAEYVMVLVVVSQRLWPNVSLPLARGLSLSIPRGAGDGHVV